MTLISQLITSRQAAVTAQSLSEIKLVSEQTQQVTWGLLNKKSLELQRIQKQAPFTAPGEAVPDSGV